MNTKIISLDQKAEIYILDFWTFFQVQDDEENYIQIPFELVRRMFALFESDEELRSRIRRMKNFYNSLKELGVTK